MFNHLRHAQDQARQAAQAWQRAGEEAAAFQQALLSPFTAPDLADLTAKVDALQAQMDTIRFLHTG